MNISNDFTNLSTRLALKSEPGFVVEKIELFPRMFKNFSPEYNGGAGDQPVWVSEIKKQFNFYVIA